MSHKKLADTYMVGGCSMDLGNNYPMNKKQATLFVNQGSYSTKNSVNAPIMAHASKHGSNQRQRPYNHHKATSGPMQLEPNPVFSIIDAQMEIMNRTTQERIENGTATADAEMIGQKFARDSDRNGTSSTKQHPSAKEAAKNKEYVSFVDGSNVMQLQKIAMQSSFESRGNSEQ